MREFYQKYQAYLPAGFFVGGFLFDVVTTDRIDQMFSLGLQGVYLFLLVLFVYWEVSPPSVFQNKERWVSKLWRWHVEVMHFLFGSLLSLYTIFYFKSASLMTSFVFMSFLVVVLVVNELPQLQKRGLVVRSTLLALCLASYLIYLVPVILGSLAVKTFMLSMCLSISFFVWIGMRLQRVSGDPKKVQEQFLVPGIIIQLIFILLYSFKALPPVPISLKHIGIYHSVEKQQKTYVLKYDRSWWRFWQSGAQTFLKREGDAVYCFVSVFSPSAFSDQLQMVWLKDSKGEWIERDSVPLTIHGGRDAGYRGYAMKSNFEAGRWQVQVKTSDDREVGRIYFDVIPSTESTTRDWRMDLL